MADAARKPTARGRPDPSRPISYKWHLPEVMAEKGMRKTVELGPLLAVRGVVLSDAQVFRLVTSVPERLSLKVLAALCDIFGCTPNDLLSTFVEGAAPLKKPKPKAAHEKPSGQGSLPSDFMPVKADVLGRTRR